MLTFLQAPSIMKPRKTQSSAGFTLAELMVVIAIIAILAAVAVPLLVRDSSEADFEKGINRVAQEIQRAKFEALSNREDRALLFTGTAKLQLAAVPMGTATYTALRDTDLPPEVEMAGLLIGAKVAGGNTPKACTTAEIRYSAVNDVMVTGACTGGLATCSGVDCGSALCPCSVTLFLRTKDDQHKARFVIYQATGYSRRYEGW